MSCRNIFSIDNKSFEAIGSFELRRMRALVGMSYLNFGIWMYKIVTLGFRSLFFAGNSRYEFARNVYRCETMDFLVSVICFMAFLASVQSVKFYGATISVTVDARTIDPADYPWKLRDHATRSNRSMSLIHPQAILLSI